MDTKPSKSLNNRFKKIKAKAADAGVGAVTSPTGLVSKTSSSMRNDVNSKPNFDVRTRFNDNIDSILNGNYEDDSKKLLSMIADDIKEPDTTLEPIFLGLIDGVMRGLNMGTKQGLTGSRIYNECKSFSYKDDHKTGTADSFTEFKNDQKQSELHGENFSYGGGKLRTSDGSIDMRPQSQKDKANKKHFGSESEAKDGYSDNETIYRHNSDAKANGASDQKSQVDHVIPCSQLCNQLKSNRALLPNDIKDILNVQPNLVVTSFKNNRLKSDKTLDVLKQEIKQGYALDAKGNRTYLNDDELSATKQMIDASKIATKAVDNATNKKVANNLLTDRNIQKRMVTDAGSAAANQSLGDVILFALKPIYFELHDCVKNGIELNNDASSFKASLKFRVNRIRTYCLETAQSFLQDGLLNIFKNFLTTLLEGIVNCFVGIFKTIFRAVKEGFKVLMEIIPILQNGDSTPAQKGDAILKLTAASLSAVVGIGLEGILSQAGIPEVFATILASILTAVFTVLIMYLLDKLDLFSTKEDLRAARVNEILTMKIDNERQEILNALAY